MGTTRTPRSLARPLKPRRILMLHPSLLRPRFTHPSLYFSSHRLISLVVFLLISTHPHGYAVTPLQSYAATHKASRRHLAKQTGHPHQAPRSKAARYYSCSCSYPSSSVAPYAPTELHAKPPHQRVCSARPSSPSPASSVASSLFASSISSSDSPASCVPTASQHSRWLSHSKKS